MTLKCHITVQNNANQCQIKLDMTPMNVKNKVTNRHLLQKKFFESHKNVIKTYILWYIMFRFLCIANAMILAMTS